MIIQLNIIIHCESKKTTDYFVEYLAERRMNVFVTHGSMCLGAGMPRKKTYLTYEIHITYCHSLDDLKDIYNFLAYKEALRAANEGFRDLFQEVIKEVKKVIPSDEPLPVEYSVYPTFYDLCDPRLVL